MSLPRKPALVVAALCGALTLGGCGTVVAGTPTADPAPQPASGPGSNPVVWVDKVCGAVLAYVTPALTPPDYTGQDLPAIRQRLSDYLGATVNGLQQSRDQLAAVGAAPVASGDQTVARVSAGLAKLQQDVAAAKAKVDAADPANPDGFKAALADTETSLKQVTAPDALGDLRSSPRLDKAAQAAPNCKKLAAPKPGG